ncbi:chordin-like protein 1 [Caerostris extrusa]|uniref:Chordin-like protein 1 n=1 Tax=Caerostris extrusa TaxID=172846 RepID=A0AAV4M7P5_CAEEX|nr:chordin-like protein 1 [Caerostris extrusa]
MKWTTWCTVGKTATSVLFQWHISSDQRTWKATATFDSRIRYLNMPFLFSCLVQTGLVLCRLKNCDSLHCFSSDPKQCCPSCKDEILPSEQAGPPNPVLVTIMVSDSQSQRGGTLSSIIL